MSRWENLDVICRTFSNWPAIVLWRCVNMLHPSLSSLTWRTRRGTQVRTLAGDRSWGTPIEVMGCDVYRLKETLGTVEAPVFLDIGANIGAFSLALLELYPAARGYAYEPNPATFAMLVDNVRRNRLEDKIALREAAIAGRPIQTTVRLKGDVHDTALVSLLGSFGRPAAEFGDPITITTLSAVVDDIRQPIDLVKIDVEGCEYDIIRNTSDETWRTIRALVVEYHPVSGNSWQDLPRILTCAGFRLARHTPAPGTQVGILWFVREPDS